MSKYLNDILANQFQAALSMMRNCIKICPQKYWEGKIANATVRQIVYHTLFCVDMYLSPNAESFKLRLRAPNSSPGSAADGNEMNSAMAPLNREFRISQNE